MTTRILRIRLVRLAGVVLALLLWTPPALSSEAIDATGKIARLRETSRELSKLASEPLPARLPPDEQREALAQRRWLEEASRRCEELAGRWERALAPVRTAAPRPGLARPPARPGPAGSAAPQRGAVAPGATAQATRQMQEMNTGFNLQMQQLQNELQRQAREINLVSNVMKTKHDTAKAAIQNIR
jgi:hypothetical protein